MSEVSFQSFLGVGGEHPADRFAPLPPEAIATRRRDATRDLRVRVSRRQRRWLDEVCGQAGRGVDRDAVVRALLDLGAELEVDWALIAGGGMLRDAVRDAVRVRRAAHDGPT